MRSSFGLLVILLSGPLLMINDGFSQKLYKKFKFGKIDANSRLSNSNVTAILQDTEGFLWVGTDDGLNRFDGYDFKTYRNAEGDTTSLLKNKIQAIFEDRNGKLWVSTLNSGLHFYDRAQDEFHRIDEFSVQHCQVMCIIEDAEHTLWIGGIQNSQSFVASLDPSTGKWKTFLLFASTDPIYCMLPDSTDTFWLGTRMHGLFKWNKTNNSLKNFLHDTKDKNSLPGNYIEDLLRDEQTQLWVATRSGLSKMDSEAKTFRNFTAQGNSSTPSLPVNEIMDLCLDGQYLWVATENGGLSRMDIRNETFTNFLADKFNPNSLINNSIWSLYKDRQGRLWVGSYAKGLCVMDINEEKFPEVDIPLRSDLVNAIVKDSKGRLWIGTEAGIVVQDNHGVRYFNHDPADKSSLSSNAVNCIYEDKKKRIWTGHWNGGISRFDEASQSFTRYVPNASQKGSLANPNVFSIAESSKTGELLVCTFDGLSILKDEDAGIFENAVENKHEGDHLLLNVLEDSQGNIWIGSYTGLSRFNIDTRKFERFFVSNDTTDVSDRVNCIFEDHNGRLWIGTNAGLHVKTGPTSFKSYTVASGLPVNFVQGILEDKKGNLWLGTTHGLCFFNPESEEFKTYDQSDGLLTEEFRRRAFFASANGQMFVGGKGINGFYPDSLKTNPNKPPIYITDLKIFNRSIRPNEKNGILTQSITSTKEIFLDHSQTFFSLYYVGINFTASYKNRYAYKLEGFDTDWNEVGNQRFASFTSLNPGTYTFRVKASNNDGLWNDEGASLIIHVLPPWWRTLWFRALALGMVGLLVLTIYQYRVRGIEQQNILLEKLVNQRTLELQESNNVLAQREQEINAQNEKLIQGQDKASTQRDLLALQNKKLEEASKTIERKNIEIVLHNENLEKEVEKRTHELLTHNHQLEQFAFISAHNLRAPVARILGLGEILKFSKNAVEEKMILERLVVTTQELDSVVKDLNKILDIRKNNSAVISEINLSAEIEMIRINLQREMEDTGTVIVEDFSSVGVIYSVKPYIDSILLNLFSNSIKYRHPDRTPVITISTEMKNEYVCLSIGDNGLGIDLSKYHEKLFRLYNRFHSHVEGKGMGLYLVKTQVTALGGKIEVASEIDKGTKFKIFVLERIENLVVS